MKFRNNETYQRIMRNPGDHRMEENEESDGKNTGGSETCVNGLELKTWRPFFNVDKWDSDRQHAM